MRTSSRKPNTTASARVLVLVLSLAVLLAATPTGGAQPAEERPNVLIVVTDDQRGGGFGRVMPALRRWLGRGGTRFTSAFTAIPNCCPSRASIFTGQYPHNHGVLNNQQGYRLPQEETIQRYLNDAGYRTALFGKYLNGWDLAEPPPHFDEFAIFRGGYVDRTWNSNASVATINGYTTKILQRRSATFLETSEATDAEPWFLYVAPWAPHGTYVPESRYEDARVGRWNGNPAVFETDLSDKPPVVRDRPGRMGLRLARWHRRGQLRTLYSVDNLMERLRATLASLGEEEETLIFFLSDNGMLWGEHGLGGPTYGKRFPYMQSVRIPLYVRWPGRVAEGAMDSRLVSNVDIAPTIMDAAGIGPDAQQPMDGRSLLDPHSRDRLLIEYFRDDEHGQDVPPWASVVDASSQYVEYYASDGITTEFEELYDLDSDRWQLTNLLHDDQMADDPNILTLRHELHTFRRCGGSTCP
ncbi:MAG TPA: sulfatase [Actinomycetota bacterium]|nr:sulfatase [Actinomycetota bacterium]